MVGSPIEGLEQYWRRKQIYDNCEVRMVGSPIEGLELYARNLRSYEACSSEWWEARLRDWNLAGPHLYRVSKDRPNGGKPD